MLVLQKPAAGFVQNELSTTHHPTDWATLFTGWQLKLTALLVWQTGCEVVLLFWHPNVDTMPSTANEVRSLFVTLRRGYSRLPHFHRSILVALGLRRRHTCLEKPNNPMIRGMLMKVPHLVVIETDEMFYNRKCREAEAAQIREPITVLHTPPEVEIPQKRVTTFTEKQLAEHLLNVNMAGYDKLRKPPPSREEREKKWARNGTFVRTF